MGEIQVTQATLTSKKDELGKLNSQFSKKVQELVAAEGALNKMWEGEANTMFHNAFNADKGQMEHFYDAVREYATKLEEIISKYAKAEKTNLETASRRNYK